MRIEKLDSFLPNKEVSVNVANIVSGNLIIVDRFLVYLEEHKRSILGDFIVNLTSKYKSLISSGMEKINTIIFKETLEKSLILKNNINLAKTVVSLVFSVLKVNIDYYEENLEIKRTQLEISRAWLLSRIYFSELLAEMINRDEAIQFLKDYFVYYANNHRKIAKHEDLNSVFESDIEGGRKNDNNLGVSVLIDNKIYASRVDRCMAPEALTDYNDSEIKHIVCCSADHAIVRNTNKNFVLTRTSTLMDGPYCDFCCHDTRYVEKIEHPPREFYEKLNKVEN